jgi:hypothetical protein
VADVRRRADNKHDTRASLDVSVRIRTRASRRSPRGACAASAAARKADLSYAPARKLPGSTRSLRRATGYRPFASCLRIIAINQRGSANNPYQIGLFSRTSATADDFGIPTGLSGQEVRFGRFTTATFPDRWVGLAALDAPVIHDVAFDELVPDQARALSDYVRIGGTLILGPGVTKGWLAHPVLSSFVAVRAGEPQLAPKMAGLNGAHGNFRNAEPFPRPSVQNGESRSRTAGSGGDRPVLGGLAACSCSASTSCARRSDT